MARRAAAKRGPPSDAPVRPSGRAPAPRDGEEALPEAAQTVDEVMTRWPATVRVFLRRGMACVGCPVGPFHTVADAASEYGVPLPVFLQELRRAARRGAG